MPRAIPPHPPLPHYYGDASKRERFVREIFDETAEWYDGIIAMLSFGSGNRYRRDALKRAGVKSGADVLDLATGTGVVARAASLLGSDVIGADASIGMLRAGKSTAPKVQAKGESLPFRSHSFDFLTIGYALRHFADLRGLFVECKRVLRPGGTILILEITPPRSRVGYAAPRCATRDSRTRSATSSSGRSANTLLVREARAVGVVALRRRLSRRRVSS